MAENGPLKGGELNAAVTSALVGIQTELLGRGPRSASMFHHGNVLVTLMHGVLSNAEKSLARTNRGEAVNHIRHLFQQTMEAEFRAAVERLTDHKVIAFISGNQIDPDIAAELFILDEPL
ncbi:MAG: Na-translocating system protein MpsC family protein [Solirubrobacteraceae bacterium]